MPPKPRPIFKTPSSSSQKDATPTSNTSSMPPPPDPPQPQGILVPEVTALNDCLTNAVVKTGQIYGFYADTHRLKIGRHAPYPPRSLTASLGREVEKYDQLCDAIQSHLRRAIAVLQRDLDREREKLKAATVPIAMDTTEDGRQAPLSSEPSTATSTESTAQKPGPLRRQSTISLSSLHRAPFPHKLDLSSIPLRLNTDEAPIQSGLASPVSLAPKSSISRASMPPDLLSAAGQTVDIDLTVPDDADLTAGMQGAIPMGPQPQGVPANLIGLDPTLGSTADKPIELDDFDMDMFSEDAARPVNQGSSSTSFKLPESVPPKLKQEDAVIDLDLFGSLNKAGGESMDGKHEGDILSALGTSIQGAAQATSQASNSTQPSGSQVPSSSSAVPGTDQHNYDFDLNMFDSGMEDFLKPDNLNASAGSSGA